MTTINFNFTINIDGNNGAEILGVPFALAGLSALAGQKRNEDSTAQNGAASGDERVNITPAGVEALLQSKIVQVLADKSKYRKRSLQAIVKATGASVDEVSAALDSLTAAGTVKQSSQSGLFYTELEATPAQTESVQSAAQTPGDKIVAFLSDKSKYTKRSLKAVAKFMNMSETEAEEHLVDLLDEGRVFISDAGNYFV